jgi:outer membrane protein W
MPRQKSTVADGVISTRDMIVTSDRLSATFVAASWHRFCYGFTRVRFPTWSTETVSRGADMRRQLLSVSIVAFVAGFIGTPAASAQQSVNLYIGGFTLRTLDARGTDDVLFQDGTFLSTFNQANGIDIRQFSTVTLGGEWLVGIGRHIEGGLGLGFYQRTVPTSYTDLVNANGTEIQQDLKLRIVPFTATFRFLPFGHDQPFQPYVGAGVGVYAWRYSETGQFADEQNNIFTGNFVGSGTAVGPVVLGGVRVSARPVGFGAEIRYQSAKGSCRQIRDLPDRRSTWVGSAICSWSTFGSRERNKPRDIQRPPFLSSRIGSSHPRRWSKRHDRPNLAARSR